MTYQTTHTPAPAEQGATDQAESAPDFLAEAENLLRQNHAEYSRLCQTAEDHVDAGDLNSGAVFALLAAWHAAHAHSGLFASARLEKLLHRIGLAIGEDLGRFDRSRLTAPENVERVLHVVTNAQNLGGLTNMVRRWIGADPGRAHSIAITHQSGNVNHEIRTLVEATGGKVYYVNREMGGLTGSALALRRIARAFDLIVGWSANSDVIPSIAFDRPENYPPILFVNHSDHMFWLGSSISQVVGSMRQAALDIATGRRGIAEDRSVLLPILAIPPSRSRSRAEAKAALGRAPDEVLMISVARPQKFRTLDGVSYADTHVPLLQANPKATLAVVGAGERPDWSEAIEAAGGRIEPLMPQDPKLWFEAADIYIDSFPFCSATSMMEAASYGLPCVSRFLWPDAARIAGMDHPGLASELLEGRSIPEYLGLLQQLIDTPSLREEKGAAIQASVADANATPGWNRFMEASIARALELPPVDPATVYGELIDDAPVFGEPDVRLQALYGFSTPYVELLRGHMTLLPFRSRLQSWVEVRRAGAFESMGSAVRNLFPEWAIRKLKDR